MKLLVSCFLVVVACAVCTAADEKWSEDDFERSPLAKDGPLLNLQDRLADIFQFKIESGQWNLDRASWQRTVSEIEKFEAANPDARIMLPSEFRGRPENALQLLRQAQLHVTVEKKWLQKMATRMGPTPPLCTLFRRIQDQAASELRNCDPGLPGYSWRSGWKEWQWTFQFETLIGNLRINNEGELLELREAKPFNRTFEFQTNGNQAFRIQLRQRDGDAIVLRQNSQGELFVAMTIGSKTFSKRGESFVELAKQHYPEVDCVLMPLLTMFAICRLLPPNNEEVRSAVIASIVEVGSMREEAQRLFVELGRENEEAREQASDRLSQRYVLFNDLILERLYDHQSSPELRARLQHIVDAHQPPTMAEHTAAVLNLTNDSDYLVSLLDDADERRLAKLTQHLEKITGQKFSDDITAWKRWSLARKSSKLAVTDANSPIAWSQLLADDGEIQTLHEQIAELLRFKAIDLGQLKTDRVAWNRRAEIFESIQNQVKSSSRRFNLSNGGPSLSFSGEKLSGRLQAALSWTQLVLRENEFPNRSLVISNEGDSGVEFQLSNSDGDMFILRQVTSGPFSMIAIIGEQTFADQAESFLKFYKRNRKLMDSNVLPALAKFGILPKQAIDAALDAK